MMSFEEKEAMPEPVLEDLEKQVLSVTSVEAASTVRSSWKQKLLSWGVEERGRLSVFADACQTDWSGLSAITGILPVPLEERTDTQYSKLFYVYLSSNYTILTLSLGTLGPVVFQLSVQDSCLVIFFFGAFCTIFPAYFSTWGARLGMRQMALSRYTFGYYGVIVPSILNLLGVFGFATLNCIVGGQALASVTNGHLSWTVGIVVFAAVSVIVSFFGYKFLHWFERYAWIPVAITTVIAVGVSWKHLGNPPPPVPVSAASILGFAGVQAGFLITWSGYAADYGSYLQPEGSGWKIFWWAYLGIFVPNVLTQSIGAAFAVAANSVPAWSAGFQAGGNVGGLIEAVFQPLGNFGKFLTVIMSLSVAPNLVSILYSASLNYQIIIPRLYVVPRYIFTILTAAIVLPISIVGAHKFDAAITNFLGLIGYWASVYVIELIIEHVYFRSNNFDNYDKEVWNTPRRLPWGLGALGAGVLSFGLVVPCMSQVWFTGPIAKTTGDLGFEIALVISAILYPPLRWLEIRLMGHL